MHSLKARVVLAAVAAILVGGCSVLTNLRDGVVPADQMRLSVSNETTIEVVLRVNGTVIANVPAGTQMNPLGGALPSLPWNAVIETVAGRQLLQLTVRAGDVWNRGNESKGDGARVDLSCGRIDLWSGPPLLGPMPGPGTPGDCD